MAQNPSRRRHQVRSARYSLFFVWCEKCIMCGGPIEHKGRRPSVRDVGTCCKPCDDQISRDIRKGLGLDPNIGLPKNA
jgi:hypothetical protein